MMMPIKPETPMTTDIAPEAAARDQPNSSIRGLRKTPKQSCVPKEPISRINDALTIIHPYEELFCESMFVFILTLQRFSGNFENSELSQSELPDLLG